MNPKGPGPKLYSSDKIYTCIVLLTHMIMFRFTNMLHMSQLDIQTKRNIVKEVRNKYLVQNPKNWDCINNVILPDQTTEELVKKVEEILNLNKTIPEKNIFLFDSQENPDQIRKSIQIAAEMFIFLNYCPPKGSVKLLNQISNNFVEDYLWAQGWM